MKQCNEITGPDNEPCVLSAGHERFTGPVHVDRITARDRIFPIVPWTNPFLHPWCYIHPDRTSSAMVWLRRTWQGICSECAATCALPPFEQFSAPVDKRAGVTCNLEGQQHQQGGTVMGVVILRLINGETISGDIRETSRGYWYHGPVGALKSTARRFYPITAVLSVEYLR